MNLLITMKLLDRSMMHHIYPITLLDEIDKVIIVRDTKGPDIDKVHYHCPPRWTLKIPIMALLFKFLLMINLAIKEKPSLIHGYLLFPHGIMSFIAGVLTRKKKGISLIAGPVELYALIGNAIGKYSYCRPLPPLNIMAKITSNILNRCNVVTVSGGYTKKFLVDIGIEKKKIFILPHVVNNKFECMNTNKVYDIVFVGRLASVKRVDVLIKSLSIVKSTFKNVKVAIVGDGECKSELEELARNLNLSENIFFAGYQPDAWNWYNRAKMSILLSEREGFPHSVIEALRCGLPVISSNCGDISDVLIDGYNGFIIDDYQDYSKFAEAIIKLMRDPELLFEHSNNALKSVQYLNTENVANVWKNIIYNI